VDKINGDQDGNGDWNITLPGGGQRIAMPPEEADKYLESWQKELDKAFDDVKHWRDRIKGSAAARKR
jgi:hypothetical protein